VIYPSVILSLLKDQLRLPSSVAVDGKRTCFDITSTVIDRRYKLHRRPAVDGYLMNGLFN